MSASLLLLVLVHWALASHQPDPGIFQFTHPIYNLSISEKWELNSPAWTTTPQRVGVYMPSGYDNVKFKIVQGDGISTFKLASKRIGNFAYLSISLKDGEILNRELQDEYDLIIKASAKNKREGNFETQCLINIKVIDDNDILPFFRDPEYKVDVDNRIPPNSRLVQLRAVDADTGLNGELLYSLRAPSDFFYVEPKSGWIRSFKPLVSGSFILTCLVEDRSSRLFFRKRNSGFNSEVNVTINVREAPSSPPILSQKTFPLRYFNEGPQKAALLEISEIDTQIDLSSDVLERGDTVLQRISSTQYLLYVSKIQRKSPEAVSLILKDNKNKVFTAENISLVMDSESRSVWFNGATEEETPRIKLSVSENILENTIIYRFRANTSYLQDQSNVKYRIHGKDNSKLPFLLERNTGIMRAKSSLIGSHQKIFEFSVVAKLENIDDRAEKAFLDVFVTVIPVNLKCPKFTNLPIDLWLNLKDSKPGQSIFIPKVDMDNVIFKLKTSEEFSDYFRLDNGAVVLNKSVNTPSQFTILAMNKCDSVLLYTSALLSVTFNSTSKTRAHGYVNDTCSMKNLYLPIFDKIKPLRTTDTAAVGKSVGFVSARDNDYGINGLVRYTSPDSFFNVNSHTGEITVIRELDALVNGSSDVYKHEMLIEATDMAFEGRKSALQKVQIAVERSNLHAPVFEKSNYYIRIKEDTLIEGELARVKAIDEDSGANGRVEYRLAIETDLVSVDPDTGAFRLERPLDREIQPFFTFPVLAIDRGTPPRHTSCNVTINLEDINDNSPVCLKEIHEVHVYEDLPNGALITCLAVNDIDDGDNAKLIYKMDKDMPFAIDAESGCLMSKLNEPLDFEDVDEYKFNVTVSDRGHPQRSTRCPVIIRIEDVNENLLPPIFTKTVYEAEIDENTMETTKLVTVKATDPEEKKVNYRISGGDGLGFFTVDKASGDVFAVEPLNAEVQEYYWLAIEAQDESRKPLSATTFVMIKVKDVNDHSPLFGEPVYYGRIVENSEANKVVVRLNATDNDLTNNTVTYEMEKGNVQSNFILDQNTGFLVTGRRHLDRETQPVHELYVKACDSSPKPLCTSVLVIVTVLDKNDNAPKFKQTAISLKIPAKKVGFLTRVFADDADEDGPNSLLTYNLEGNTDTRFSIDEYGRFFTSEPILPNAIINFTVSAEDNGETRLRSDVSVTLTAVEPVSTSNHSNHPPIFKSPEKWRHLYASDRDAVGTVLGRVEVEDADGDPLWYTITNTFWNPNETFTFHGNNGELVLARRVNLIDINLKTIELEIMVSDGWMEVYEKINIHITRSLHIRPTFEQTTNEVELSDGFAVGYVIHQLHSQINSTNSGVSHAQNIVYNIHSIDEILAKDSIKVDSATGSLLLEKPLTQLIGRRFNVVVAAKVNGGLESFAMVTFKRIPVNRYAPKCVDKTFDFYCEENGEVGRVLAFDLDEEINGEVEYSVQSGDPDKIFNIQNNTGIITAVKPILEKATILVKVEDKAKVNAKSSICKVNVFRRNGVSALKFKKDYNRLAVRTLSYVNEPLLILEADHDDFVSLGSKDCKLAQVGFGNGIVRQKQFLGPNDIDKKICVVYGQSYDQIIYRNLTVTPIGDDQDVSMAYELHGYVRGDAFPGTPVFTDKNLTQKLRIPTKGKKPRVISPQERYFGVDSNGFVYTKDLRSIPGMNFWTFLIGMQTSELTTALINVYIDLILANKNAPIFGDELQFDLSIPAYQGTRIGTLTATDPDGDVVKYALRSSAGFGNKIKLNRDSGEIALTSDVLTLKSKQEILEVIASDGMHTTIQRVTILIQNKHQTLKCRSEYIVNAPENYTSSHPKELLQLDWPLNSEFGENFDFQILNDESMTFNLDYQLGTLYLLGQNPIDRERTSELNIIVKTTSLHKAERFCHSMIHVKVDDVNDCIPQFHHLPYEIWLSEDVREGERLLTVKAKDEDVGLYGSVRYALDSDAVEFIEINKIDGKVRLKKKMDDAQANVGNVYRFHVIAQDQGNPPLQSKAEVVIHISDRNQPIFSHTRYTSRISEASAPGTTIFNVHAKSNTNGTLAYVISDGDPKKQFSMDFFTGRIMVNSELDREETPEYILEVKAIDLSRKRMNASAYVKVTVDDVNDTPPTFLQQIYQFEIPESASEGILIGTVKAIDKDLTPKDNVIKYSIHNGDKDVISIDAHTGMIYLSKKLDFETKNEFEWILNASDSDGFTSEALLRLKIKDENDNPPKFVSQEPLIIILSSDSTTGQFIHQLEIEDPDTVLTSVPSHVFGIVTGDETMFTLDSNVGILRRTRDFDSEELKNLKLGNIQVYNLNITVSDGLFTTPLQVKVIFKPSTQQLEPLTFESLTSTVVINENRVIPNKTVVKALSSIGGIAPKTYNSTIAQPLLTVNSNTGNVYLAQRPARSAEPVFVPFLVQDAYNNIAVQRMEVKIESDNINSPRFIAPSDGYSLHISSASMDGDRIAKILALDDDEEDVLEYSINPTPDFLGLDPKTGYLTVKGMVRVESNDVDVDVTVSDRNNPPHISSTKINIQIVDGPVPQFSRFHYFFSISEDAAQGKLIGQLMASQGENVKYDIPQSDNKRSVPFLVEEESGRITLQQKIDREIEKKYDFVVRVRDRDQRTAFSYVTINVVDVNDNPPTFETNLRELSIREDVPKNTVIFIFLATDKDAGDNSKLSYELNENGHFKIDKEQGFLTVKSELDRETKDRHQLKITARDEGGLSSTFNFTIKVLDVNDNAPQFDQLMYRVTIPLKGLKIGQKIVDFKVTDADTAAVQNVSVSVFTHPSNNYLAINGSTVILKRIPVDRVRVSGKLIGFDGVYSSQADIEVMFVGDPESTECDEKEEKIILKSIHSNQLIRDLGNNNVVLSNHLVDAQKLSFQIVNGSKLIVKDDVIPGNYSLRIRSKIRSVHQDAIFCMKLLTIQILNYNKVAPQFSLQEYAVHYNENQRASEDKMNLVLKLEARDTDLGIFGDIKYNVVEKESIPEAAKYFYLDEFSGALMAKGTIDREKYSNFTLKVEAVDGGGLKDYANVRIYIDDTNDNEPQFEQPVYHLKILENEAIGYEVLRLIALDPDNNTQLSFYLKDAQARNYLSLDQKSGVLKLLKSLDYEAIQRLKFDVIVSDGELNSTALIDIEVLDVNDNSPRFERTIYEVTCKENTKPGSDVIQVKASDPDSQHFGKISYSISGEDAQLFTITDNGIIKTTGQLDFEKQKIYRLNVRAVDGGTPALSDDCLVTVVVEDVNDNPPIFDICNLTAVIQEGVEAGQALLRVSISDNDGDKFGAPFRLEITGAGASAFTFDPLMNLITTRQLSYNEQNVYNLTVTAYDSGDLSSSCPLKVFVKQQSRHPPQVQPQTILINTLMGEFSVKNLGKVYASDKDPADMLRYALVQGETSKKTPQISVDPIQGTLSALSTLLPGLHRFNVSVTDGKYTVYTPITIDVTNIDQEALENSVSVRMGGIGINDFIQRYMGKLHEVLVKVLGVKMTSMRILAVQDVMSHRKTKRSPEAVIVPPAASQLEVELLLTVLRESGGYHRPVYVKQKITEGIARITAESGLEVTSLTSEICRRDTCSKGECRDRIWLDNVNSNSFDDPQTGNFYSFPRFQRTFECICRQGFGGRHCDVAVNQCSQDDVCSKAEVCVPMEDDPSGQECICPPGTKGDRCRENTCPNAAECSQKASLSMLGQGYFQMFIGQSIEQRMDISIEFKTASRSAVIMHGEGLSDFHVLRIVDGYLEYEWDCGSGPGEVKIHQKLVDDGKWHTVRVVRRRKHVQMILDDTFNGANSSMGMNDVINLYSDSMVLTFGANVTDMNTKKKSFDSLTLSISLQSASELHKIIQNGLVGCIGRIGLDGFDLPKTPQGLRMYNARIGCDAQLMGPCLNAPCLNQGQCFPKKDSNSYSCICPQRYTGVKCEIDLNACASNPCPKGIKCHNLYNDFHCSCPPGFTGKTCQMHGDWDPCVTNPCGPFGVCRREKATFTCSCSDGFGGNFCSERVPHLLPDSLLPGSPQFYILLAGVLLALLLAAIIVILCRRQNQNMNKKSQDSDRLPLEDASDPLIATPVPAVYRNPTGVGTEKPPPRPPRQRNHNANLPTVEVRPMPSIHRNNVETPPQPPKHRNLYDTAADLELKPQPPPHRSLTKNEKKMTEDPLDTDEGSDYLTMKPVKRSPTTPPKHQKGTDMVKLYDNPTDAPDG
ncbi:unnamed protein product [Bursaphelenchus xylophilus]|nr:unnamed protein product [Bursaphelenchus xylophilus]CAG9130525.1 unnamed protein product [Bursaphelenchus xylophilus]